MSYTKPHTLLLRPPPRRSGARGLLVPPLGLAYLASSLQQVGLPVTLLDAWGEGLSWQETCARVATLRPAVLGLSAMTPVADVAEYTAQLLRPLVGHIVLGGPHPTSSREKILETQPAIDSLVVGEGEHTLPRWVKAIGDGDLSTPVPGVITRDWIGPEAPLPPVDELPLPARSFLPNHRYRYPLAISSPMTTLITSRGCPFHCTFCDQTVTGRRFRPRSVEGVVAELLELQAQGFRYVCFYDDVFTLDRRRVLNLCEAMRKGGVHLAWKCEARVDCVDAEMLREMAASGCVTIAFGLETANQHGLDALKKETTVEEARRAFVMARHFGIETLAYVLFGIPGETRADALRTLDFCTQVGVNFVQFATLAPTPGTELAEQAEREGWPRVDVRGPFDDDLARPAVLPPGWSEQDLRDLMSEAIRRWYLRPGFLVRQVVRAARGGNLPSQLVEGLRHVESSWRMWSSGGGGSVSSP